MRLEDLDNIKRREVWERKKQRAYFQKIADASNYNEATKIADEYLIWAGYNSLKVPNLKVEKMPDLTELSNILEVGKMS